jgi:hypothetical protein
MNRSRHCNNFGTATFARCRAVSRTCAMSAALSAVWTEAAEVSNVNDYIVSRKNKRVRKTEQLKLKYTHEAANAVKKKKKDQIQSKQTILTKV